MGLKLDWLTDDARTFLSRGYLQGDKTIEERYLTIANRVEQISRIEGISERILEYVERGWISFSSPILSNFGEDYGLPISCNMGRISDTLDSILSGIHEVGMLAKNGAGTAKNFSDIRAIGEAIADGGMSEGILPWIRLYAEAIKSVSQGNVRRGFFTAYLSIDHPEILSFLDIGTPKSPINNITTGVTIPDGWIQDLKEGDPSKRKIWSKLLQTRNDIGFPYILFEDNCNKNCNPIFKEKGIWLDNSNICVTGDQRVVTDRGYLTAKELYENGEGLVLFDNEEAVPASSMKLVEKDSDVYRITLGNGMTHDITEYHKVKVNTKRDTYEDIQCKDLKIGDKVCIQTNKGLFGRKDAVEEAFLLGLWQADGTGDKTNSKSIDIWEKDFDLEPMIQEYHNKLLSKYSNLYKPTYKTKGGRFTEVTVRDNTVRKRRLSSDLYGKVFNFKKGVVPYWIWQGTEETQWSYIKGLLFGDGTIYVSNLTEKLKNKVIQLNLSSIDKDFLKEIQLIFNNLGLRSSIRLLKKGGLRKLPSSDGTLKEYNTKDCYRLIVGNYNDCLRIENKTGFLSRKDIKIEDRKYRDNTRKSYEITSIEYLGKQDVFCCKVYTDKRHWICNGFITHNCTEVLGVNNDIKEFACCLLSVNARHFLDWEDHPYFIQDCNITLDTVLTEYIDKSEGIPGLEKARRYAIEHRTIGLGVLGFHSLLQDNNIIFGSLPSYQMNDRLFRNIRTKSDEASRLMAKLWGEPEFMKGTGYRNDSRLAVAPTKSTSFIMDASSGIECIKSNFHAKTLAKIQVEYKNPILEKLLESKGMNINRVWENILKNNGSVSRLDFLTDHEKAVFRTSSEVSQVDVIKLAAQRQKYIDQSQSLNLTFHPETSPKDINKLILMAHEEGVKTLYYQYSTNAAQEFNRSLLECSACDG